jgi:homoserine dehydrogenase
LHAEDKSGVLADVTRILADCDISIEAILQKPPAKNETIVPIILLTQVTQEHKLNAAIAKIEQLETVSGKVNRIRLETLG